MLDAIAGEHFETPVVELHGDIHSDLARGCAQNLAHTVVQTKLLGSVVEAGFGRDPWIRFLLARQYRHGFSYKSSLSRPKGRFRAEIAETRRDGPTRG